LVKALNKQGEGTFTPADVEALERLAFQFAVVLDWAQRHRPSDELFSGRRSAPTAMPADDRDFAPIQPRSLPEMGVARLAQALAKEVHLPPSEVRTIRQAAFLHNIGKFGLPDHILMKPGPLTPEERKVIETHPLIGASRLAGISYLEELIPLIRSHQERYDGTGYPDGLHGEEIPLGARIIAITNAFDVMIHEQPYRPAMSIPEACLILEQEAGRQFDPDLVEVFVRMVREWPEDIDSSDVA
jgi:hypothetical protein